MKSIAKESWYKESVRPIRIDDQELADVTEEMWSELLFVLDGDFKGKSLPLRGQLWASTWGPRIKVRNVQGQLTSIPINIEVMPVPPPPKEGEEQRGIDIAGYLTLTAPKVLAIVLPIGGAPTAQVKEFLLENQEVLKAKMASVISHELTHAKDLIPPGTYDSPFEEGQLDWGKYFNDVYEVRAFMQQVARDVYNTLSKAGDDPTFQSLGPSERIQHAMQTSPVWQEMEKYLTPENKKKIIRGVVNFLRDRGILE